MTYKGSKIIPQPQGLDEWRSEGSKQLHVSDDEEAHSTARARLKAGMKEAKMINRDWRGTSTPTAIQICGRRFKMSKATKAGAGIMCEATFPYLLDTFHAHLDLRNKNFG